MTAPTECEREDCKQIADTASDVYCVITGGLLSYPTYSAQTILTHYEDDVSTQIDEAVADARRAVLAEVRDRLEQSGQLAAAVFVGRMITKEQQHDGP